MQSRTMPRFTPLHPLFGVQVDGVDLTRSLDDDTFAAVKDALDRHSLLVFRNQPVDDAAQTVFSRRFGRLEKTRVGAVGQGGDLVVLTNLDAQGRVLPPTDHQLFHAKANQLWHSDASFRKVPAYASVLSGRRVATRGGETEFVSTRVAYRTLDQVTRTRIDGLTAVHHFAHSRSLVQPGRLTEAEDKDLPAVRHPLVRRHSFTGEAALLIGSHVREIEGLDREEGRKLLDRLAAWATREECIHVHRWQPHDLIVWDNSAVLHRGRPWNEREPRHLIRATVADDGYRAGALTAA